MDGIRARCMGSRSARAKAVAIGAPIRAVQVMDNRVYYSEPSDALLDNEQIRCLHEQVMALPDVECLVVRRYFFDGKKQREVGEELGLTESRINQILSGALERLKNRIQRSSGGSGALG